jgi:hypothetical protein
MPKTTWIFVLSQFVTHGTLKFNLNSLSHNNFKLEVALVNKRWLCTRLQNQLQEGTSMTWKNIFGYTKVITNGGPCSYDELESGDMST